MRVSFQTTTELAAQLIRKGKPPAGVKVLVLLDAYYLWRRVVQACGDQRFHFVSTLKRHRRLFKAGGKRTAGRYGKNLWPRRRTAPLIIANLPGSARYRCVAAGWLVVNTLGPLPVICSRNGTATHPDRRSALDH